METTVETRSTSATRPVTPEQVKAWDCRTASMFDKDRLAPVVAANETFARNFSQLMSTRLGIACEVATQSSQQETCAAFLKKSGEFPYFVTLQLGALRETAVLEIDSMLIYPIVDLLLGGSGKEVQIAREVTDIEDNVAKDFVRVLCHELQNAWKAFNLEIRVGSRQSVEQLKQLFGKENALSFNFSFSMPDSGGGFRLMLPISTSTAFLKTIIKEPEVKDSPKKASMSPRLADKLLDSAFGLDLELLQGKVFANDLLNLAVGKILRLDISVRTPVVLKVGGLETFEAIPVRSGKHRAAQLMERLGQSAAQS